VPERPANGNGRSEETNDLLRLIAGRADPEFHLHIDEGAISTTIADGAIRAETKVEPTSLVISEDAIAVKPPTRTVLDRDPDGKLIGSHEEPL
jgi:hypothetical protein